MNKLQIPKHTKVRTTFTLSYEAQTTLQWFKSRGISKSHALSIITETFSLENLPEIQKTPLLYKRSFVISSEGLTKLNNVSKVLGIPRNVIIDHLIVEQGRFERGVVNKEQEDLRFIYDKIRALVNELKALTLTDNILFEQLDDIEY